jgi:hypothetical protein
MRAVVKELSKERTERTLRTIILMVLLAALVGQTLEELKLRTKDNIHYAGVRRACRRAEERRCQSKTYTGIQGACPETTSRIVSGVCT